MKFTQEKALVHLTGSADLSSIKMEAIEKLVHDYPFFSPGQYLFAAKLKKEDHPLVGSQAMKTALYFTNPHWLQFQLEALKDPGIDQAPKQELDTALLRSIRQKDIEWDEMISLPKIEETIEEAKKELAIDIKKAGDEALHKLGIIGIDPKLVSIVGRLKYRTSYGQNVLNHSIETAYLCSIIAEELGVDAAVARKAGFFHDIGKAVDHESQGTHTEIGYTILKKFGLDEEVSKAIFGNIGTLMSFVVGARDAYILSKEFSLKGSASDMPATDIG